MLNDAQRLLLIRYERLGDVVLSSAVARSLTQTRPDLDVSFLTDRINGQSLWHLPWIRTLIVTDAQSFSHRDRFRALVHKLRSMRFDVVIDMHGSFRQPRAGFLPGLIGARVRVGYRHRFSHRLFTHVIERKVYDRAYVDLALDLVRPVVPGVVAAAPRCALTPSEIWMARAALKGTTEPLVAIAPGARAALRRWPVERFGAVARRLMESGYSVVVVGGPGDVEFVSALVSGLDNRVPFVIAGNVRALLATFFHCSLVVCNDSGPKHLAAALGIPTVAVHGPSDPMVWGTPGGDHVVVTLDLACRPCNAFVACPLGTTACLADLPVAPVLKAALHSLRTRADRREPICEPAPSEVVEL